MTNIPITNSPLAGARIADPGTAPVQQRGTYRERDDNSVSLAGRVIDTEEPDRSSARIDIVRAVAALRHIEPSTEPALVFTHFAAVCVPAVCDSIVIDMAEEGHKYRIVQPAPHQLAGAPASPSALSTSVTGDAVLGRASVTLTVSAGTDPAAGPPFTGVLAFGWNDGYQPTPVDAAFLNLMVQHATALIGQERLQSTLTAADVARAIQRKLSRNRVLASAVGTVMGLHHLDQTQALELLKRISARTGQDLHDVADSIVHTASPPVRPSTAPPSSLRQTPTASTTP